jgi:intracellular septation protein A
MNEEKKWRRLEVFLEFFIFGVIVGIIEDLIAVKLSTGEAITWKVFGIVVLVAIPFAVIGELVVDRIDFIKLFKKNHK